MPKHIPLAQRHPNPKFQFTLDAQAVDDLAAIMQMTGANLKQGSETVCNALACYRKQLEQQKEGVQ